MIIAIAMALAPVAGVTIAWILTRGSLAASRRALADLERRHADLRRRVDEYCQIHEMELAAKRLIDAFRGEPWCGHSACRQNWIDTGETECVEPAATLVENQP